jgi:hypothetical protein
MTIGFANRSSVAAPRALPGNVQIPRSTASTWRRRGFRLVVTTDPFDQEKQHALEVATIKNMVLAPENRHMPLGTLARYAQRIGVFVAASTWAKLVRERG